MHIINPLFPQRADPKVGCKLLAANRKGETLLHNSQCPGDKNKVIAQTGNCSQYKYQTGIPPWGSSERMLWDTMDYILDNILIQW